MLEKTLSKDNPFKGNEKIQLHFFFVFLYTIECIESFFSEMHVLSMLQMLDKACLLNLYYQLVIPAWVRILYTLYYIVYIWDYVNYGYKRNMCVYDIIEFNKMVNLSLFNVDKVNHNQVTKGKLNQPRAVSIIGVVETRESRRSDHTLEISKCKHTF